APLQEARGGGEGKAAAALRAGPVACEATRRRDRLDLPLEEADWRGGECRGGAIRARLAGACEPAERGGHRRRQAERTPDRGPARSEEHTSELQSLTNLVCRLLLEKKKKILTETESKDINFEQQATKMIQLEHDYSC